MYSLRTSRRCRSLVISIRSRHSRRALAIHLSAIAFARGARTVALMIRTPAAVSTASNAAVNLTSPDKKREAGSVILEAHQQVPGLLRHPLPRRVAGDPGQVHRAALYPVASGRKGLHVRADAEAPGHPRQRPRRTPRRCPRRTPRGRDRPGRRSPATPEPAPLTRPSTPSAGLAPAWPWTPGLPWPP